MELLQHLAIHRSLGRVLGVHPALGPQSARGILEKLSHPQEVFRRLDVPQDATMLGSMHVLHRQLQQFSGPLAQAELTRCWSEPSSQPPTDGLSRIEIHLHHYFFNLATRVIAGARTLQALVPDVMTDAAIATTGVAQTWRAALSAAGGTPQSGDPALLSDVDPHAMWIARTMIHYAARDAWCDVLTADRADHYGIASGLLALCVAASRLPRMYDAATRLRALLPAEDLESLFLLADECATPAPDLIRADDFANLADTLRVRDLGKHFPRQDAALYAARRSAHMFARQLNALTSRSVAPRARPRGDGVDEQLRIDASHIQQLRLEFEHRLYSALAQRGVPNARQHLAPLVTHVLQYFDVTFARLHDATPAPPELVAQFAAMHAAIAQRNALAALTRLAPTEPAGLLAEEFAKLQDILHDGAASVIHHVEQEACAAIDALLHREQLQNALGDDGVQEIYKRLRLDDVNVRWSVALALWCGMRAQRYADVADVLIACGVPGAIALRARLSNARATDGIVAYHDDGRVSVMSAGSDNLSAALAQANHAFAARAESDATSHDVRATPPTASSPAMDTRAEVAPSAPLAAPRIADTIDAQNPYLRMENNFGHLMRVLWRACRRAGRDFERDARFNPLRINVSLWTQHTLNHSLYWQERIALAIAYDDMGLLIDTLGDAHVGGATQLRTILHLPPPGYAL